MITDNIVKTYSYNKDVLQSYTTTDNGEINTTTLEYSNNNFYPTKIGNNNLTWDNGRITSYNNTTFEYNVYGRRTKKTVGTKVHTYTLDNTNIIKEHILDTTNNIDVTLEYIYDQSNQLVGVVEGNNVYYYDKDATNEIKGIIDTNGIYVIKYTYTAYGEVEKDILVNTNISTYNPFNTDESATLNSIKVSFYKGVPIFRTNMERSGSFGAIFLRRYWKDKTGVLHKLNDLDEVRHERGHNWQLMMMGIANYGFGIGIPLLFMFGPWAAQGGDNYYRAPWEITADKLGGVSRPVHTQKDIDYGWWYLKRLIGFPLISPRYF